ncbi:MAG: peptidylprolyl isomerase [Paludibacteraceae bacterium]|nr:peptidylprolyl isomerase [Paludibacteraceae bacterium]
MANIIIKTSLGDIVVKLYDETPIHRDNFLKLVEEGYFNGTIFHRVIKNFMIQGGDPKSKNPTPNGSYGTGGPDYTLEAEIKPNLFHKRGALAAARTGDEVNPERRSSGSQFYIVWGEVYNEGKLRQLDQQLKQMATKQCFDKLVAERRSEIMQLRRDRNQEGLMALQEELIAKAKELSKEAQGLSDEQKQVYSTLGGTPFLDGQYTVFGEVLEGLDIVEKIQNSPTRPGDRPKEDIFVNEMVCMG